MRWLHGYFAKVSFLLDRLHDNFHACLKGMPKGRVASSAVEHSAFNRLVLRSNRRRPISVRLVSFGKNAFADWFFLALKSHQRLLSTSLGIGSYRALRYGLRQGLGRINP